MTVIPEAEWRALAAAHRERLAPWVDGHRDRRRRGNRHPVFDFLFTYYSFRPGRLLRWSPGSGHILQSGAREFGGLPRWQTEGDDAVLDRSSVGERKRGTARWVAGLMRSIEGRPGRFGCFGLHEWAMVYRTKPAEIRHESYPLRISPEEIAATVERGPLCCTHYDAFRFFTPTAMPLNATKPGREGRMESEQAGCLHTNMDLYKWCYKLSPWVSSDLLADAFLLAAEIRELDMRASPYDLAELGFPPVRIETEDGRAEYEAAQRTFWERAVPIRQRLLAACEALA